MSDSTALFYYYGGKTRLLGAYPPPKHRTIVEPFAGSASYSIRHLLNGNADRAILIEKDPRVVALWTRLLVMTEDEIRRLKAPPPGTWTEDFLFMTCAASNAIARCRGYTMTERASEVFKHTKKSLLSKIPRLKGKVEIFHGSYDEYMIPDEATWFVDPPYQVRESNTKTLFPKGMGYARDCSSDSLDYENLADWCRSLPGQVIVCEQDGATWLPFRHLNRGGQNSQGVKYKELIWETEGLVTTKKTKTDDVLTIEKSEATALFVVQEANEGLSAIKSMPPLASQSDYETAVKIVAEVKTQYAVVEETRKSFTAPLNDVVSRINAFFKPATSALLKAEAILKERIVAYSAAANAERERLLAEASAAPSRAEASTAIAAAGNAIVNKPSNLSQRTDWSGEVVDAKLIPREYLIPDVATLIAITKARRGDPGIPGWKAIPKEIVSVRGARKA